MKAVLNAGVEPGSDVFAAAWQAIGDAVTLSRGLRAIPREQLIADLIRMAAEDGLDGPFGAAEQIVMASDVLRGVVYNLDAAGERLRDALRATGQLRAVAGLTEMTNSGVGGSTRSQSGSR